MAQVFEKVEVIVKIRGDQGKETGFRRKGNTVDNLGKEIKLF